MRNGANAKPPANAIGSATACEAFQHIVERRPDDVALRTLDDAVSLTWSELGERVRRVAAGLSTLGVGAGESVALLLPNTVDCHVVDFAAMHLGAVPFTIYNTSSAEQIEHQLRLTAARVIVTEQAFLPRVDAARAALGGSVEHVVVTDGDGGTTTLGEVEHAGDPSFPFEERWRAVRPDDTITMIFTSGTTGPPKAVQWAHRTVMAQLRALDAAGIPLPTDDLISFLPMAHAGGRLAAHYMSLAHGARVTVCPDLLELPKYLAGVHPDALFAVPRLWEKLQVGLHAMIAADDQHAALEQALQENLARVRDADAAGSTPRQQADGDEQAGAVKLFRPLLAKLGLDRVKAAFVGGAPSAPELSQFFRAVGVPMLEAYGLTEGSLNVFNRIDDFRCGTAGKPLPGVELRLADDGEILVRSELNMVGYRNDPEATAAAIDGEGWLRTGDIGSMDADGYLSIIDRKKEIMINAAGKNMSPALIESVMKAETPLIGQIVAIGDRRRFVTALIALDPDAARGYAQRKGLSQETVEALASAPEIVEELQRAIDRGNERLSRVEQIKRFRVLPVAWLPDSEELTPTLKLKRKAILAKYADEVDDLYPEPLAEASSASS